MSACIFCRVVRKELPAQVVYEDEGVLAFRDIDPKAPTHVLIIPKMHLGSLMEMTDAEAPLLGGIHRVIREIAGTLDLAKSGFRVVINNGDNAGQAVGHVHFHLLGGRKLGWPPG